MSCANYCFFSHFTGDLLIEFYVCVYTYIYVYISFIPSVFDTVDWVTGRASCQSSKVLWKTNGRPIVGPGRTGVISAIIGQLNKKLYKVNFN